MASAKVPFAGFGGGVNMHDAMELLRANQLLNGENIILDENGGATKRKGTVNKITIGAGSDRILSAYVWYRFPGSGNDPAVLIHLSDGTIRYTTNLSSFTTLWSSLSTSAPFCFENGLGASGVAKVFASNGVDDFRFWDGTATGTNASAPKGKYLKWWKSTMWVANIASNPHQLWASNAGNGETFGGSAFVNIEPGVGDEITGLWGLPEELVVFKLRGRWHLINPNTFENRIVDPVNGCESHFSIIGKDDKVYFLTRRGIAQFLAHGMAELVSRNIDPIFTQNVLNYNALKTVWAYEHETRLGWLLPSATDTFPTFGIEYYPLSEDRPWMFQRLPARVAVNYRKAGEERLLTGSNNANKLQEAFVGNDDDGTVFSGFLDTRWDPLNDGYIRKYLRELRFLGRGKVFVGVRRDYKDSIDRSRLLDFTVVQPIWDDNLWDDENWGPNAVSKPLAIRPDLYGRQFSLRFSDSETAAVGDLLRVGSKEFSVSRGAWSILGVIAECESMSEVFV